MLQLALKLPYKTLYVSGEESQKQIKLRAQRISPDSEQCYVLTETNTQQIFKQIEGLKPDILVIDSIQTLQSDFLEASAGSVSRHIRERCSPGLRSHIIRRYTLSSTSAGWGKG